MISLALILANKLTETVIDCMVFNVSASLEFLLPLLCTILVPSHNTRSKSLAAFSHNYRCNNGQR